MQDNTYKYSQHSYHHHFIRGIHTYVVSVEAFNPFVLFVWANKCHL